MDTMYIGHKQNRIAIFIAILFTSQISICQTLKGDIINCNKGFLGFKMSQGADLLVVRDLLDTRTFRYIDKNWKEIPQIIYKNWVHLELSKDGFTIVGSEKINLDGDCEAFIFDFIGDLWVERPKFEERVFRESVLGSGGHEFAISSDGKTIAILNHTKWSDAKTFLTILKFIDNVWIKEFEIEISDCKEPRGQFDSSANTFLIVGSNSKYNLFTKIFMKKNNKWEENSDLIEFEYWGDIKLSNDGNELYCIFNLNTPDSSTIQVNIEKYDINPDEITKSFQQKLPWWYSYSSDFSGNGNCFVTGYDPISDFNKVRIFKLKDDTFFELSTNFVSNDSSQYYGYDVQLSDDCKTVAFGLSPKSLPFSTPPQVRVYDISDLTSTISEFTNNNQIKIYPNPTLGTLYIEGIKLPVELTIRNVNGQIILNQKLESNVLDIDKYPNGIYFISFKNNETFETFKIVKI